MDSLRVGSCLFEGLKADIVSQVIVFANGGGLAQVSIFRAVAMSR